MGAGRLGGCFIEWVLAGLAVRTRRALGVLQAFIDAPARLSCASFFTHASPGRSHAQPSRAERLPGRQPPALSPHPSPFCTQIFKVKVKKI